ncbi:MAG: hypothetical protein J6S56_02120 [Bacteroidales bacterium]|nr:hypothetical protein [Bacteroidales bacterium]
MCHRPDQCSSLPVVPSRWLPPKGYTAITVFGRVLTRKDDYDEWMRHATSKAYQELYHHERIHLRQAVSVRNSWICYYALYFWFYLKGRPLRYGHQVAYLCNPFELEAYLFEVDDLYAQNQSKGCIGWKRLASYPPSLWRALMLDVSSNQCPSRKLPRSEFLKRVKLFMTDKW